MPYKSSNIPRKTFYSVMSAEILPIYKAIIKFQGFIKSAIILIERTRKQSGLVNHMKKALLKLLIDTRNVSFFSEKLMIILKKTYISINFKILTYI